MPVPDKYKTLGVHAHLSGAPSSIITPDGVAELGMGAFTSGDVVVQLGLTNDAASSRTVTLSITSADAPGTSVESSVELTAGETADVDVTFPQGQFDYLTARIKLSVTDGTDIETTTIRVQANKGTASAANTELELVSTASGYEVRDVASATRVTSIYTDDTTVAYDAVFQTDPLGLRCEVTADEIDDGDGLFGVRVTHRFYNPTPGSLTIPQFRSIQDYLCLTASDTFKGECQSPMREVIETTTTGNSQTARNGGTGSTGIVPQNANYPNTWLIPCVHWVYPAASTGLSADIVEWESWNLMGEAFQRTRPVGLTMIHGRITGGPATGVCGWAKQGRLVSAEVRDNNNRDTSLYTDSVVLAPGDEILVVCELRYDKASSAPDSDFAGLDYHRRCVRAFAGDVKYNADYEAAVSVTLSFRNKSLDSHIEAELPDADGFRQVSAVPAIAALFSGGDLDEVWFCTSADGYDVNDIRWAHGEGPVADGNVSYNEEEWREETDPGAWFAGPAEKRWFRDRDNQRFFIKLEAAADETAIYVVDSDNPYGFQAASVEQLDNGWADYIDIYLEDWKSKDWQEVQLRQITGTPFAHASITAAAFCDSVDETRFPTSAATVQSMIEYAGRPDSPKLSGWLGRSTELADCVNAHEEELEICDELNAHALALERHELGVLKAWKWHGLGLDAFKRQSYGVNYDRVCRMRREQGSGFFMVEEPHSCDVMLTQVGMWIVESTAFDSGSLVGDLAMARFVVPRSQFVIQSREGSFGDTATSEASLTAIYGVGAKPELYSNPNTASDQVADRIPRPPTLSNITLSKNLSNTVLAATVTGSTTGVQYIIEFRRAGVLTYRAVKTTPGVNINSALVGEPDELVATIRVRNTWYVGELYELDNTPAVSLPPDTRVMRHASIARVART